MSTFSRTTPSLPNDPYQSTHTEGHNDRPAAVCDLGYGKGKLMGAAEENLINKHSALLYLTGIWITIVIS
jgi:hypothetical protein